MLFMILIDGPLFLSVLNVFYAAFLLLYGKILLNMLLGLIKWASSIA